MRTIGRMTSRLCLGVAVAASIATAAAGQEKANHYGLSFPAEVGGFTFRETYSFEKDQPGLGYDVTYIRPGWRADVYIYDLGRTSIPENLNSDALRAQFEQAEGDIFSGQKQGRYQNVALIARNTIADAQGRERLACGKLKIRWVKAKADGDSYLCVAGWKNKFVKYRISGPTQAGGDATVRRFLEAWAKILWPPSPAPR